MTAPGTQRQTWLVCALLCMAVLVVFLPALRCNFISFDDPDYVTSNRDIQQGLNWQDIKWALTTSHAANWHPLTWISHTMDYSLYGLNPAGHHLTSVALHMASVALLFLLLRHITGALWPSAFVGAMFGLHPLRVESVVWISERKDVLSTFFWMLTVGAYVRYVDNLKSQISKFKFYYVLALIFFALGLMAKSMLVTLPFVLLLLDYWPLARLELGPNFSWRPLLEKIPFFVLAAGDSVVTFLIQNHFGVVMALRSFPLSVRLANVPFAYVRYMAKNFCPTGLAIFYPSRLLGPLAVGGSLCLLGAVSVWMVRRWRAQPYLVVGWCWFLGMLVPTIGLVQVSTQSMADRYSYLPSVGLWIMVAWGVRDWAGDRPWARAMTALAGAAAVIACMVLTPRQVQYWRNSRTLFTRAAAVTDQYFLAYYNIGCYAVDRGDYGEAIYDYKKALSSEPDNTLWSNHSRAYNDLGFAYLHEGQISNAVANFEKALSLQPIYPQAYYNLGRAFLTNNQPDVAIDCLQRALALDENPNILGALAAAYAGAGRLSEAMSTAQRASQLALAQNNQALAGALESQLRTYQARAGGSHP